MKITKLFIATTALVAIASCSGSDFLGDKEALNAAYEAPISFGSATPTLTRADKGGSDAATDLNNNFVVFGYKTTSSSAKQTVFSNYQVNYVANTANTTTTNSANWEYVGADYKNVPADMTDHKGVAGNTASGVEQSVKFWDFSASNYKFYGYSLGVGNTADDPDTYANASLMSTEERYSLQGTKSQLLPCYISELTTINEPSGSTPKQVSLRFLSFLSKIRMGFYETIPGYSVKNLKFYINNTTKSTKTVTQDGLKATLYDVDTRIPDGGKYIITFDANGKPVVTLKTDEGLYPPIYTASIELGELNGFAGKEYREEDVAQYLGRTSNAATFAYVSYTDASHNEPYTKVLPNSEGTKLTMKVDFTLVSRDGYGETIEVTGATATVPTAFTQWKPNYAYTYLFKISDNTNGQIGEVTGLYPITLDAVVASELDGTQETITTVDNTNITTYAKASNVLSDDEYVSGANIYVVVGDNTPLTVGTNAKLYYVTIEDGAIEKVTEKSVAKALVNGTTNATDKTWTITDALDKKMVVTDTEGSMLSAITTIPAADSPRDVDITVNGAVFKPAVAYVQVPENTDLTEGVTYYTSATGEGGAEAGASAKAGASTYRKTSKATGYYVFEYIVDSTHKYYKVVKIQ